MNARKDNLVPFELPAEYDPDLSSAVVSAHQEIAKAGLDPGQIMEVVVLQAQQLTKAAGAAFLVLEGREMVYCAVAGTAEPHFGLRLPVDASFSGKAVSTGETLRSEDAQNDPRIDRAAAVQLDARSLVAVPLYHRRQLIGVLQVMSPRPHAFDDRSARALEMMCGFLGATMSHASDFQQQVAHANQTEGALRRSEKLAAIGRHSASIAHEIKNPLESLGNLLYLLQHHPGLDQTALNYVSLAQHEHAQAVTISKKTLDFSRESLQPIAVKLSSILDNVLAFYANKIQYKRIMVKKKYQTEGEIQGFPGEFRQVFSNLIVNALETLPEVSGRLIVQLMPSRHWKSGHKGFRIAIADNGPGIRREHRDKIFTPFFTTKSKGTGLGLWVTGGILEKYGGSIRLRSRFHPEKGGTCFSVFLPTEHQWTA